MLWYLTLHRWIRPRAEGASLMAEHFGWMRNQHEAGNVLFSGPTADRAMGVIVLRGSSQEAVRDLLATEPFVRDGFRQYELLEWEVHQALGVGTFTPPQIRTAPQEVR